MTIPSEMRVTPRRCLGSRAVSCQYYNITKCRGPVVVAMWNGAGWDGMQEIFLEYSE